MNETPLRWRKSSHSTQTGECVEVAEHPGGHVLVRNSQRPGAGTLSLAAPAAGAWLAGAKRGELDDFTG